MSRQWFGSWGAELSETDFACALAGGVSLYSGGEDRIRWTGELLQYAEDARSHFAPDAREMVERWRRSFPPAASVAMEISTLRAGADPAWLVSTLKRADGVASVAFLDERGRAVARRWDWPIDIGYLGDAPSTQLRDRLSQDPHQGLVRHVEVATAREQIDLLLFPGTLAEALAAFVLSPRLPDVHTVLALGGIGTSRDVLAALGAMRSEASAAVAGVLDIPVEKQAAWFGALVRALARDRTLDRALFAAGFAPLLLAQPGVLAASHASKVAGDLLEALRPKSGSGLESFGPRLPAPIPGFNDFASHYSEGKLDWEKPDPALTLKDLKKHAKPPEKVVGRYVQGQLLRDGTRTDDALEPGRVYALAIRIGAPAQGWTSPSTPFPDHELPPDPKGHQLTVVVVSPALFSQPQTAPLWLPAAGDSKPCVFHFTPPVGARDVRARVVVLHENRILQTLTMTAAVADSAVTPALSIEVESVFRCNLDDLGGRPGFDAAFLLNDNDGERGMTAFGPNTAYVSLGPTDALIKKLRGTLEQITKEPDDYATLASDASKQLLVTLARLGRQFGSALRELPGMSPVFSALAAAPGRVQISTLHPDELVPLEYIYDRVFPKPAATLCAAVLAGTPCVDCPDNDMTVCPQGFWGMRHVIERRMFDEQASTQLRAQGADVGIAPEASQRSAPVERVTSVLLGAATKAAKFDKPAFDAAIHEVGTLLVEGKAKLCPSSSWSQWKEQIASEKPQVLLLVTHTEEEMGASVLEIGDTDHLAAEEIDAAYVHEPPAAHPVPGPIVLLFGCRTALDEVPFSSFIAAFRRARASVVVATIGTVRGRHMGPLAREAMRVLLACQKRASCTVGEFVRELRVQALLCNLPVGLALVAYGEADWQLGGST
ncbi:MAG: hypothetical protein AB7T06_19115 [Kofleriaceae bacterium]